MALEIRHPNEAVADHGARKREVKSPVYKMLRGPNSGGIRC